MPRSSFSQYSLHSSTNNELLVLASKMEVWMQIWATTDPDITSFAFGGPSWTYLRDDKPKVAAVHMTVAHADGCLGYWHAFGRRIAHVPTSYEVVTAHARVDGARPRLFDPNFIDGRAVEARNRAHMRALLRCADAYDSTTLQEEVLITLEEGDQSLQNLASRTGATVTQVTVAALRLWLTELVALPIAECLIGERMLVAAKHHGR